MTNKDKISKGLVIEKNGSYVSLFDMGNEDSDIKESKGGIVIEKSDSGEGFSIFAVDSVESAKQIMESNNEKILRA